MCKNKKLETLFYVNDNEKNNAIYGTKECKECLENSNNSFYIVKNNDKIGLLKKGDKNIISAENMGLECIGFMPNFSADNFGSKEFMADYNVKYAYMGGSMANEISSAEMVIAFGKAGILCSFGSGGILVDKIEENILKIKEALPNGPFCFNLLNAPQEPAKEQKIVNLFLKYGIRVIEASAFMILSESLVQYRLTGLFRDSNGNVVAKNKIIAKISRDKIAKRFMEPAPQKIVKSLLAKNLITQEEAELSKYIPMADDITAEGDSGGHTDNRPMTTLLSVIIKLRDEIQEKYNYSKKIRVGVGGGISSPDIMLAAFEMGADYVVTGSINQACQEAGTSDWVKKLLSEAEYTDVANVRAADMFEIGAHVQVLTKGTLYPMRAIKLTELYEKFDRLEDIPSEDRQKIEKQLFQGTFEEIWEQTKIFFKQIHHEEMITKAEADPKKKMALIFRWYLGLAPNWARRAVMERKNDFQIWCGPSIGSFNNWLKNTEFNKPENRFVVKIADLLFKEAVILKRQNFLRDFFN